jgi:hypothetical protein
MEHEIHLFNTQNQYCSFQGFTFAQKDVPIIFLPLVVSGFPFLSRRDRPDHVLRYYPLIFTTTNPNHHSMLDGINLRSLSGFRSPNIMPNEYGIAKPGVIISSGNLALTIGRTSQSFIFTVQHNFPLPHSAIPNGVQLSVPFNYLASLFILDHGIHGRSIRIRLISPSQAFKLDKSAVVPTHKRHMLDEHGQQVLLYHWNQSDHFDLLGILQAREMVAQIGPSVSMEVLVDWGARSKDAAALVDGTEVQVLFENADTGRVSQLQSFPVPSQVAKAAALRCSIQQGPEFHFRLQSSRGRPYSVGSEAFGRLTPYSIPSKRHCLESRSRPDRLEGEDFIEYRRRVLRPGSPGRHYRPPTSSTRSYRLRSHQKELKTRPMGSAYPGEAVVSMDGRVDNID